MSHVVDLTIAFLEFKNNKPIIKDAENISFITTKNNKRKNEQSNSLSLNYLRATLSGLVLETLCKLFTYDDGQFVDKERYENWIHPIVNLVNTTFSDRSLPEYCLFVENILSPCVSAMASKVNETLWKPLNVALLKQTRDEVPAIRYGALYCVYKLFESLGMPALGILPETMTYLSELMEDDNIEVERLVQRFIKVIENLSGEPIQKYL